MSVPELSDVPAPAKLNLFLHVLGQRADGYHLLQSVFVLIDWCDTLHFERRAHGALSRADHNPGAALPADDLVLRAARALQAATGCTWGAHITLTKRIPQQAGLGGGSSDAASTLLALNRLWGLGLGLEQLLQLGQGLGADVPFFLGGRNAWVEGIGERLQPIDVPLRRYLVLKPATGSASAEIFRHPALTRNSAPITIESFVASGLGRGMILRNDLQAVAERLNPSIKQGLHWLHERGLEARMSGSGSAVFAPLGSSPPPACVGLPSGWQARVCSVLREHPLLGWR